MHRVVYLFIFDTRYTHTAVKPSLDWPQYGMICFGNVNLKYNQNDQLILKDISFTIKPKEKVNIFKNVKNN